MRYLGIDYGDRHVGFAIGDDETRVGVPLHTITYLTPDHLVDEIKKIVREESIDVLVVGMPLYRIGRHDAAQIQREKTETFVHTLQSAMATPVKIQDESFTSSQAARHIRETSIRTKDDHSIAAMLILQSFLDSLAP
ncbi:Holliday junction resolvase RuvX [Candidatus Uhrbacteria bacterium]|nr:Holliday junction resolvase RuvX [Candidatus Uhrbacteria bacterium]